MNTPGRLIWQPTKTVHLPALCSSLGQSQARNIANLYLTGPREMRARLALHTEISWKASFICLILFGLSLAGSVSEPRATRHKTAAGGKT